MCGLRLEPVAFNEHDPENDASEPTTVVVASRSPGSYGWVIVIVNPHWYSHSIVSVSELALTAYCVSMG